MKNRAITLAATYRLTFTPPIGTTPQEEPSAALVVAFHEAVRRTGTVLQEIAAGSIGGPLAIELEATTEMHEEDAPTSV